MRRKKHGISYDEMLKNKPLKDYLEEKGNDEDEGEEYQEGVE